MIVTHKLEMNLNRKSEEAWISVVQGDCYSREVQITLLENGSAWTLPETLETAIFYRKTDGTEGVYDTMPDGTKAWYAEGNALTIRLAPQMMTCEGPVSVQLELRSGEAVLRSFRFYLAVSGAVEGTSEDYHNWRSKYLPQITGGEPGQLIQIQTVDEEGRVVSAKGVWASSAGGSGENGATFTPYISEAGDLSWTNDKGLENPQTVNIMGPQGEKGQDLRKQLYGKTVVCFGDSLFGLYRGSTSAPAKIADHTGATVYNVGFGGTRMSVHPYDGYAQFSMWALADAVATGDFSQQEAHAAEGANYFGEQLAVLKGIDFSAVDMAVIHFGTNDFTGNVALDDGTEGYSTICGALRYSLSKLMTAYPNLRIFVSLPVFRYWTGDDGSTVYSGTYTNGNGITLPEVCKALAAVAREYNIPALDGYHAMGVNRINAAAFYTDGTHHNELGRERFGVFLGAGLIAQGAAPAPAEDGSDSGTPDSGSGGDSDGETTAYTNQIPISTDTDGSVFNGVGYREGYRLSTSGGLSVASGMYVTGFIPAAYLDVVRLKNVVHSSTESTASNQRIALYDANKNFLFLAGANATSALLKQHDENGNVTQFTVTNYDSNDASSAAFFRINGSYIGADSVITVNEEIV